MLTHRVRDIGGYRPRLHDQPQQIDIISLLQRHFICTLIVSLICHFRDLQPCIAQSLVFLELFVERVSRIDNSIWHPMRLSILLGSLLTSAGSVRCKGRSGQRGLWQTRQMVVFRELLSEFDRLYLWLLRIFGRGIATFAASISLGVPGSLLLFRCKGPCSWLANCCSFYS